MKKLLIGLIVLGFQIPAHADVYMKTALMGFTESETWTSGQKQRTESKVPMMGHMVTITRVDQGVQWTVDLEQMIYEERPLAMERTEVPSPGDPRRQMSQMARGQSAMGPGSEEEADCIPTIAKLPHTRSFAGISATGYKLGCQNSPEGMIVWMAPPQGKLAQIDKELKTYNEAYFSAIYGSYSPKERQEMIEAAKALGSAVMTTMSPGMNQMKQLPKEGVTLAMEMVGQPTQMGMGQGGLMFETKEIQAGRFESSLFEIPAGVRQVPDLAQEQASRFMKQMHLPPEAQKYLDESQYRADEEY